MSMQALYDPVGAVNYEDYHTCLMLDAHLILNDARLRHFAQPLRLWAPGERQPVLHSHLDGYQHHPAQL